MFGNECLGELNYEGTTAAIFMAGLFISFLVDYISKRFLLWRQSKESGRDAEATTAPTSDAKSASPANSAVVPSHGHSEHVDLHGEADAKINVLVLEAGIIFHSLRTFSSIQSHREKYVANPQQSSASRSSYPATPSSLHSSSSSSSTKCSKASHSAPASRDFHPRLLQRSQGTSWQLASRSSRPSGWPSVSACSTDSTAVTLRRSSRSVPWMQ